MPPVAQRTATSQPPISQPPPRPIAPVAPVSGPVSGPTQQSAPRPVAPEGPRQYDRPQREVIFQTVAVPYGYGPRRYRDKSPNRLYKEYLLWFIEKYGPRSKERPLSFKQWLKWAKKKGIVPQWSADGDGTEEGQEPAEDKMEMTGVDVKRIIKISILGVSAVLVLAGLVLAIQNPGKKESSGDASASGEGAIIGGENSIV